VVGVTPPPLIKGFVFISYNNERLLRCTPFSAIYKYIYWRTQSIDESLYGGTLLEDLT
jgi:hypothetical protein